MKRLPSLIASLAAALALSAAAHAQEVKGVDGDWTGKLEAGGAELNLIFHIKTTGGKTVVTIDSLDQGAMGIPVTGIKRDGQKVSMDVQAVQGAYEATLSADGKSMSGTWSQLGNSLPLVVTKK
jgi:hypothetical protein